MHYDNVGCPGVEVMDTRGETFLHRYVDGVGATQVATLPTTCHTHTQSLVAYTFFVGLVSSP